MVNSYTVKIRDDTFYTFSFIPNHVSFGSTGEEAWENHRQYLKENFNLTLSITSPIYYNLNEFQNLEEN